MDFVTEYCERASHNFWAEPVNALSNIAFVVAAIAAWRLAIKYRSNNMVKSLIVLAGLIGVGSFMFHTFASKTAELADVIPIWSFVASYVIYSIYQSTERDKKLTAIISVISLVITGGIVFLTMGGENTSNEPAALNGSLQYVPAVVSLYVYVIVSYVLKLKYRKTILLSAVAFSASLFFRTIDLEICEATHELGSHFMWHILNAVMVGLLLKVMIITDADTLATKN